MPNYLGVNNDELTLGGVGSTKMYALGRIQANITPSSVGAATVAEQTFTVLGVRLGDFVDITPPSIVAGVAPCCARVSAQDTIAISFVNPTAGALTPAAGIYQIQLNR